MCFWGDMSAVDGISTCWSDKRMLLRESDSRHVYRQMRKCLWTSAESERCTGVDLVDLTFLSSSSILVAVGAFWWGERPASAGSGSESASFDFRMLNAERVRLGCG